MCSSQWLNGTTNAIISDNTQHNLRYISCAYLARMKNLQIHKDITYVHWTLYPCIVSYRSYCCIYKPLLKRNHCSRKKFVHLFQASSNCFSSGPVISSSHRPLPNKKATLRQTSMSSRGFEPTTAAGERPQVYTLYSVATGTGACSNYFEAFQSSLMPGHVIRFSTVTEHRG